MIRIALAVILTLLMLVGAAAAQDAFPNRPITIANPFPPGGIADLTGRPLASTLIESK